MSDRYFVLLFYTPAYDFFCARLNALFGLLLDPKDKRL